MTIAPTSRIAAGWYADPTDSRITRWWDGTNWTMNVCRAPERPNASQAGPPVLSAVPAPTPSVAPMAAVVSVAPVIAAPVAAAPVDPMAQAIIQTSVDRTGATPPPRVVSAIEELALLMEVNASRQSRANAPGLHATAGAFLGNPDQNYSNGMSPNTLDPSDIGTHTVGVGGGVQFTFRSKPAITAAIIVIGIAAIIIYKLSGH